MILLNKKPVQIDKFPDGTPRINIEKEKAYSYYIAIGDNSCVMTWLYEGNDELMYLIMIKKHLDKLGIEKVVLDMPYIPNARMDRIKHKDEVFTLKYFCEVINDLNFYYVNVLDAHSDVSTALLNNCFNDTPTSHIRQAMNYIKEDLVFYFPDAGAAKRYTNLFPTIPYCYGEKNRDWETGKILGLDIRTNGIDLTNKNILMIDDIIAYGGSLYYSAKELKKRGTNKIYAYATHTENSILDREKGTLIKSLEDRTVERLFTTNSLFKGEHEKITVMEV